MLQDILHTVDGSKVYYLIESYWAEYSKKMAIYKSSLPYQYKELCLLMTIDHLVYDKHIIDNYKCDMLRAMISLHGDKYKALCMLQELIPKLPRELHHKYKNFKDLIDG